MDAAEALDAALAHGCKPEVSGNWVTFTPPPPVDVLMALVGRGDEVARLVKERESI